MKKKIGSSLVVGTGISGIRSALDLAEQGYQVTLIDRAPNLGGILTSTRSYGDEVLIVARKQFEDSTFALGKPREERIFFDTDDSWKLELDEFVSAINENKPIKYGKSSEALHVMEILEKIYDESGFYHEE